MHSMRLQLGLGDAVDGTLLGAFCAAPALDRELIFGGQQRDGVETLTSYVEGDPDVYASLLDDDAAVIEYEVTPEGDGCVAFLRRELGADGLSITRALEQEQVAVVPPIVVESDRTVTLTLVGVGDDLSAAVDQLPGAVDPTVLQLTAGPTAQAPAVTGRQREALDAAWCVGYYEVPRRNGIEAVADELDCSVSTASELVRRGEAALVGAALDPAGRGQR